MKIKSLLLIVSLLTIPMFAFCQDSFNTELRYEVNIVHPPISVTKEALKEANTLIDLNPYYKSDWVRTYQSVEITTSYKGVVSKTVNKNDTLSQAQKEQLYTADLGAEIAVKVRYLPENNLKHNDIKEIKFTFTVKPENEASYTGGQRQLSTYLKKQAINKLPIGSFTGYELATIKFTVDEEGAITDAHVFEPLYRKPKDEPIDSLLVAAICNMPDWTPASYANGKQVKQEFVLTVGNHESCVINLLNIRN